MQCNLRRMWGDFMLIKNVKHSVCQFEVIEVLLESNERGGVCRTPLENRYLILIVSQVFLIDTSKIHCNHLKRLKLSVTTFSLILFSSYPVTQFPVIQFLRIHFPLSHFPVTTKNTQRLIELVRSH